MRDLLDRRFVIVSGKGGVGKTTVSAAIALAATRAGRRVLLAMCNAKERLSALLGTAPIGADITTVADGLDAVNISPHRALEEYGTMVLKIRAVYRVVFENRHIRPMLDAIPGMQEWAMLGKAWYHTTEETHGRPRYDLVIVDAPATGHGLDMMRVPRVILSVAPPGLLRREAQRCWSLLCDRDRAETVLVTAPEEMPINEAIEMYDALGALGVSVARVVVNRVTPATLDVADREAIGRLRAKNGDPTLASLLEVALRRSTGVDRERAHLDRLRARVAVPLVLLPRLFVDSFGRAQIEALSREIEGQVVHRPTPADREGVRTGAVR